MGSFALSASGTSYYHVDPPRRTRLARRAMAGGLVLFALLAVAGGWAATRPIQLIVDGETVTVRAGVTIEDLVNRGDVTSPAGDLLAVDGTVLAKGGGKPPVLSRNGSEASSGERVYEGDLVASVPGEDVVESVVTTEAAIPAKTVYEGTGSLLDIESLGVAGLERKTFGVQSGIVVTSTVLREPVDSVVVRRHPRPGDKVVALTFDDGPWPRSTRRVLEVLREKRVRATFFLLGRQVKHNPTLAKEVAAGGHLIASHTYGHKKLTLLTKGKVGKEMRSAERVLVRVVGVKPKWVRPPYGSTNGMVLSQAKKAHERVVLWDVDSRDWTKPGVKKIARNVMKHTKPGSIVLLHDGGGNRNQTIAALPLIIDRLRAKGYEFVTVAEIAELRAAQRRAKRQGGGTPGG